MTATVCTCGHQIAPADASATADEKAAQEHAKVCGLQGYPAGWQASRQWVAGHWGEAS